MGNCHGTCHPVSWSPRCLNGGVHQVFRQDIALDRSEKSHQRGSSSPLELQRILVMSFGEMQLAISCNRLTSNGLASNCCPLHRLKAKNKHHHHPPRKTQMLHIPAPSLQPKTLPPCFLFLPNGLGSCYSNRMSSTVTPVAA